MAFSFLRPPRISSLALAAILSVISPLTQRAAAQLSPNTGGEEARILSLENAWNQAEQQRDAKALSLLLADTLVYVEFDGSLMGKQELLAHVSDKSVRPQQIANTAMKVYLYAKIAVVTGIYRDTGTLGGKQYSRQERFTDTWIQMEKGWQCVASQSTIMGH